jgi:hypothetical protein
MSSMVEAFGFFMLGMIGGTFVLAITLRRLLISDYRASSGFVRGFAEQWLERLGRPAFDPEQVCTCSFCGWPNVPPRPMMPSEMLQEMGVWSEQSDSEESKEP